MSAHQTKDLVKRELKRRKAPRHGLSIVWVILWSPVLWILTGLLIVSLWRFPKDFFNGLAASSFAFAFALGSVLFVCFPCRPLYVFGHELTHWFAAVLTGHKADFPRLGLQKGSVNVTQPTLFIALAPYFLPFFLILSAIAIAITRLFWHNAPSLFWNLAFAWLGLCYSYHIVLTILALAHGQSDLQFRGPVLSYSVIVFGNFLVLYLSLVLVSQNWRAGWNIPWQLTQTLINKCVNYSGLSV
jgi:hypothetical protein